MGGKIYTIRDVLAWGEPRLSNKNIRLQEARDLLSYVLKKSESYLIGHGNASVSPIKVQAYKDLIRKRLRGIPFAYLVGRKGFYGLDFFVTQDTLIPRPETEELVDAVLKRCDATFSGTIADIGTGSGCIAITLAKFLPRAVLYATDLSLKALAVAKKNARTYAVSRRIIFTQGHLLDALPIGKKIDILLSNPPYLKREELANVPFEPVEALYGGKLGLEIIDELIEGIIERDIPFSIIEIGFNQDAWLEQKSRRIQGYAFHFLKDASTRTRFVVIKKREAD